LDGTDRTTIVAQWDTTISPDDVLIGRGACLDPQIRHEYNKDMMSSLDGSAQ
jgi:hypothetical protein